MAGELVTTADLVAFPGGSDLAAPVVAAAADLVRAYCGWHIAPEREDTVVVDCHGGATLVLPGTMNLTEVTGVRNVTGDPTGVPVTGYRVHATEAFTAGILTHPGGWPYGVLELDIVHGYATCPDAIKAAVVELAGAVERGDLSQRTLGDRSESWRDNLSASARQALDQHRIPRSP